MANPGDTVRVQTSTETYEGRLLPSTDEKMVVVKLKSGYNIGLPKDQVTSINVIETYIETQKETGKKPAVKKGLPTISILHTGGTIASRVDYRTGGVYAAFSPEDLLMMFPELGTLANFESRLIANMWSDDLRFANLTMLAKAIAEEIKKGVDGIIVGMGTDNLAVGSAAVAFMIQQSPIPIIFVGSQRSSDRPSADAALNLTTAAYFITHSDFAGVAICMHHTSEDTTCAIQPPTKTYKLHSSRRDAFHAINDEPYVLVNYTKKEMHWNKTDYLKKDPQRKAVVKAEMEDKVGLLKVHVNMFPEEILVFKGCKGLVLEGTGLGHTPGHAPNPESAPNKEIFAAIKKLTQAGCVVVMTTQTLYGRVDLNVYSKGRDLLDMGVVSGEDMLANTAFVKLAWLLAHHSAEETKQLVGRNMIGEITPRTIYHQQYP